MNNPSITSPSGAIARPTSFHVSNALVPSASLGGARNRSGVYACLKVLIACMAGTILGACASSQSNNLPSAARAPEGQILRAGDVVKISFPRAATLDTTQQIRQDGKINLYLVGEVAAAELSPADLEKKLLELYASQVVSREVRVTLVSSAFAVFVTGAVLHPGKLMPQRPLTVFDAIMEAGGFDNAKANTKAVKVFRQEGGKTQTFTFDLKATLEGKPTEPFYLKAYDSVYVPERFSWF